MSYTHIENKTHPKFEHLTNTTNKEKKKDKIWQRRRERRPKQAISINNYMDG